MYKLSAYYLARSAADVPIELLNTLLFVIVTYWFGGLQRDAGCFFGTLFSLLLVVLVAEAWGLLVGAIFFNPKDGQAFTTVIILAMLLVSRRRMGHYPLDCHHKSIAAHVQQH
jgi:ABC-type multidrug transport system permease subunit